MLGLLLLLLAAPSRVLAGPTDADDDTVDDVLAQLTQQKEIAQNRLEGESLIKELQVCSTCLKCRFANSTSSEVLHMTVSHGITRPSCFATCATD